MNFIQELQAPIKKLLKEYLDLQRLGHDMNLFPEYEPDHIRMTVIIDHSEYGEYVGVLPVDVTEWIDRDELITFVSCDQFTEIDHGENAKLLEFSEESIINHMRNNFDKIELIKS